MAIKISNIKIGGKRVQNESQSAVARHIQDMLARDNCEATIRISRYYSDRWYSIEDYDAKVARDRSNE